MVSRYGVVPARMAVAEVDQPVTVTALTNVAELSFPLLANVVYRFDFLVVYRSAATTTGFRLGAVWPAASLGTAQVDTVQAAAGTGAEMSGVLTGSGQSVMTPSVPAANADLVARLEGVVRPTAAGTLQVQVASEVAGSAVTVKAGSVGLLWAAP